MKCKRAGEQQQQHMEIKERRRNEFQEEKKDKLKCLCSRIGQSIIDKSPFQSKCCAKTVLFKGWSGLRVEELAGWWVT